MTNADDPAYPEITSHAAHDSYGNPFTGIEVKPGLTKREEFAKAAMVGILQHNEILFTPERAAKTAIEIADALLAALNATEVLA